MISLDDLAAALETILVNPEYEGISYDATHSEPWEYDSWCCERRFKTVRELLLWMISEEGRPQVFDDDTTALAILKYRGV